MTRGVCLRIVTWPGREEVAPSSWGFRFLPPLCFCPSAAGAGRAAAAAALMLRLLKCLAGALPCCRCCGCGSTAHPHGELLCWACQGCQMLCGGSSLYADRHEPCEGAVRPGCLASRRARVHGQGTEACRMKGRGSQNWMVLLTVARRRTLLGRAEVQMHGHEPEGAPANAPQTRISARAGQPAVLLLPHRWSWEGRVGGQGS